MKEVLSGRPALLAQHCLRKPSTEATVSLQSCAIRRSSKDASDSFQKQATFYDTASLAELIEGNDALISAFNPGWKDPNLYGDQLLVDSAGHSGISVQDFAVAMIDELERPLHIRQRFTVGY